jgi:hypothetical protein
MTAHCLMRRKEDRRMYRASVCIVLACATLFASPAIAQQMTEPGGRPEDAKLAATNPDEYAWQLFLFINMQAQAGTAGVVDPGKKSIREYDPDRAVVWETWALASGLVVAPNPDQSLRLVDNKSEIFKRPATQPGEWEKLDRGAAKVPLTANLQGVIPALTAAVNHRHGGFARFAAPLGEPGGDEEVRMNRSTYDTIRTKRLYSVEGLEDAAAKAKAAGQKLLVNFDAASKEVKAQWILLKNCDPTNPCPDKDRYHWRVIENPTTKVREVWGLASMHIITKDLPSWFWSDFGHIDCERGDGPCSDFSADPDNTLRDSTTNGPGGVGPSGSNGIRNETLNSKWQFYRLRGSQISFVTSEGFPTILSNPIIEASFQKSSCMACHALATVGIRGTVPDSGSSLPYFLKMDFVRNIGSSQPPFPDIGAPVCAKFFAKPSGPCPDDHSNEQPLYFQTDFLWSMPFRAFSEK